MRAPRVLPEVIGTFKPTFCEDPIGLPHPVGEAHHKTCLAAGFFFI